MMAPEKLDTLISCLPDSRYKTLLAAEIDRLREIEKVAKTYFDFADLFIKNHLRDCPEYDAAALAFADLIEAEANDRHL